MCDLFHNYINSNESENYHLNLYAEKDNREILFTKDHIIPKSRGGKNILANYQTMCVECNNKKGNTTGCDFCDNKKDLFNSTEHWYLKKKDDDIIIFLKKHKTQLNLTQDEKDDLGIAILKIKNLFESLYNIKNVDDEHFYVILEKI
jgi:hypothetical protein